MVFDSFLEKKGNIKGEFCLLGQKRKMHYQHWRISTLCNFFQPYSTMHSKSDTRRYFLMSRMFSFRLRRGPGQMVMAVQPTKEV